MPIVNSILDAFFRTLDVVDVARERLDRALGRGPRVEPWAAEWSPTPAHGTPADERDGRDRSGTERDGSAHDDDAPRAARAPARAPRPAKPAAPAPKKKAKAAAPVGKRGGANRKGSVDRSGKDFDSPRAKAIVEHLRSEGGGVITDDAAVDGKRVLARVLWALGAADRAGSELGLTAADASALLHLAAGVEVFSTNVARTCRDETDLIVESTPDGRSKRYKLSEAGRTAAAKLEVRPI